MRVAAVTPSFVAICGVSFGRGPRDDADVRRHLDPQDKGAWSAAGGVVMAVAITAATLSKPLWLVCLLGVIAAAGFYGMLAPLLRWWPWLRDGQDEAGVGTIAAGHTISAGGDISAATSIEAGGSINAGGSIQSGTEPFVPHGPPLPAWLGQQITELRGLLATLERVLDAEPFDSEKAFSVHQHFWHIRDDVDRKLHTSAPDWVDYFNAGQIPTGADLFYPQADRIRNQFVPSIESTIDQIAHIQAQLSG